MRHSSRTTPARAAVRPAGGGADRAADRPAGHGGGPTERGVRGGPGASRRLRIAPAERRRKTALVMAGLLALGSAAGLLRGLTSCAPAASPDRARPLTAAEAQRLAGMRAQNYRDARVGLRVELGRPGRQTRFAGWIDWQHRALSLGVAGPTAQTDGLLQAAPGLIATRSADPGQPAAAVAGGSAPPAAAKPSSGASGPSGGGGGGLAIREAQEPPAQLPDDRWRARPIAAPIGSVRPVDTLVSLLFTVASPGPDAADLLARSQARWLGRDTVGDTKVDILLGPAVPPTTPAAMPATPPKPTEPATKTKTTPTAAKTAMTAPTALAAMGGAVRYWIDGGSRLYRLEALFGRDLPVKVELLRDEGRPFALAAPLGGAPVTPRAVTVAEGSTLAKLRQADRATGGGRIRLTLPTVDGGIRQAGGWLDWRSTVAYLVIRNPDRKGQAALLRADAAGVATRAATGKAAAGRDGLPPVPPPRDAAWAFGPWSRQRDANGTYDLDLLLNEALSLSARGRDDPDAARRAARWLRTDLIGGTHTTVYEIPKPVEKTVAPGQARMRYWVDRSGTLRRLELRTRSGALAQLDITPADVPTLSRVPLR